MSSSEAADEWDFTVPVDEAELMAELRRHGVRPGHRVQIRTAREPLTAPAIEFCGSLAGFPEPTWADFEHAGEVARGDFIIT